MRRIFATLAGSAAVLLGVAAPAVFALRFQAQARNFQVVKEGVLYRSGQTKLFGLKSLIHDYGIRTVVTLRDAPAAGEAPPDLAEERYCLSEEINYVRIPPRHWESADGPPPVQEGVDRFLAVMRDPANYPVLVHCCAGVHRTGAYCEIYHMEFDRWSNRQAIDDLIAHGYDNLENEKDILGYLTNYEPTWKRERGAPAP
jgi:protein tyrosine/serine phosphatase